MLTSFYGYKAGKYTLFKEMLSTWCFSAKKGQKVVVCSPHGDYVLKFEGKFKPKKAKIKITMEEFN